MKCNYCGSKMRPKGAGNSTGSIYFKCKNKKCGRTIWKRMPFKIPEPIVPKSNVW